MGEGPASGDDREWERDQPVGMIAMGESGDDHEWERVGMIANGRVCG